MGAPRGTVLQPKHPVYPNLILLCLDSSRNLHSETCNVNLHRADFSSDCRATKQLLDLRIHLKPTRYGFTTLDKVPMYVHKSIFHRPRGIFTKLHHMLFNRFPNRLQTLKSGGSEHPRRSLYYILRFWSCLSKMIPWGLKRSELNC